MTETPLQRARQRLAAARSVVVSTGAGISAESGVPTFRGAGGLWRKFRPEDLATPGAWRRDRRTVWQWYDWRRGECLRLEPNAGHIALAALERRCEDFLLVTQNVDDLHRRAGSHRLVELHGNLFVLRCDRCGAEHRNREHPIPEPLPCEDPACAGKDARLRPGVVWFGEMLDAQALQHVAAALMRCEVFLLVGSSSSVYPAAGLLDLARAHGAFSIEVNLEATPATRAVDVALHGKAGEILPDLIGGGACNRRSDEIRDPRGSPRPELDDA